MLKDKIFIRLGLSAAAALLFSCAGGEIGGPLGEPRVGPGNANGDSGTPESNEATGPMSPFSGLPLEDSTCPSVAPDVSASNGWQSTQASLAAVDTLDFEVKARPGNSNLDGIVAIGGQDIGEFSDAAILVRFATDGLVDARDGSVYDRDVSFPYQAGVWYDIAISADISTETYDVKIARCGDPPQPLITGATFRSDASVTHKLTTWATFTSTSETIELATPSWAASGSCAPATCQSLGHMCGQASDGCAGNLNCGDCGSGEACVSGLCVDDPVSVPPPAPAPPPACTPATCQSLEFECGSVSDGCGGSLNCGDCQGGYSCSNRVCIQDPVSPPPVSGDPDRPWAHNTGPSNPGVLRPMGSQTITTDGAVLEDIDLTGTLTIDADNVTVRNFKVHGGSGSITGYGIKILTGHSGIVLEDGEIYNRGTGIFGMGWTGRRLYIHEMGGDGTKVQGTGGPVVMEYSFLEKLGKQDGSHADGNQTIGATASSITFRYNNCWMPAEGPDYPGAPYKSNACFMNSAGARMNIEYNWLNGGNYTVFCAKSGEPAGPVNLRYNRFGRDYRYGTHSGACGQVIGNVWDDTGNPI